ncbi:MAG: preprotein translocase subunit SecE [Oscillospiraceae bacterium]|nr:preprotein translocase subunit SecE [Oscillospiraceae bacterium]
MKARKDENQREDLNKNLNSNKIIKWFKECKSEIKKVIWPDKKQVTNNTIAVIVMVLLSAAFIGILDMGLYWPIRFLLGKF